MGVRSLGIALLALAVAGSAEAGMFAGGSSKAKLPKAADLLMKMGDQRLSLRRKMEVKYAEPQWGALWKQSLRSQVKPIDHSLTQK